MHIWRAVAAMTLLCVASHAGVDQRVVQSLSEVLQKYVREYIDTEGRAPQGVRDVCDRAAALLLGGHDDLNKIDDIRRSPLVHEALGVAAFDMYGWREGLSESTYELLRHVMAKHLERKMVLGVSRLDGQRHVDMFQCTPAHKMAAFASAVVPRLNEDTELAWPDAFRMTEMVLEAQQINDDAFVLFYVEWSKLKNAVVVRDATIQYARDRGMHKAYKLMRGVMDAQLSREQHRSLLQKSIWSID